MEKKDGGKGTEGVSIANFKKYGRSIGVMFEFPAVFLFADLWNECHNQFPRTILFTHLEDSWQLQTGKQ